VPSRDEILSHLFSLKNPIVIGHEAADPDAVAAAYALGKLLDAPIGFPGLSREGKLLLKKLGASYELFPSLKEKDVIVVDTNHVEKLGGLDLSEARSVTVIDHHASEPNIPGTLFIFPDASSTSEIVARLWEGRDVPEDVREALVAGMLFDTRWLKIARGDTLKLLGELLGQRSLEEFLDLYEEDISERIAKLKALRKGEIIRVGDFLIAMTDAGSFEASVASLLVTAGADVAIAYSESSRGDRLSLRLSRRAQRMGFSAEKLLSNLTELGASCGGHRGAAGCFLPPKTASEASKHLVEHVVKLLRSKGYSAELRRY